MEANFVVADTQASRRTRTAPHRPARQPGVHFDIYFFTQHQEFA